jgi:hypothetical protein
MTTPFVPISLFAALIVSLVAAVPLSASGSAVLAVSALGGFTIALGCLAWWIICADREADPRVYMERTANRFDARWGKFERDFWAYVDTVEAETH